MKAYSGYVAGLAIFGTAAVVIGYYTVQAVKAVADGYAKKNSEAKS